MTDTLQDQVSGLADALGKLPAEQQAGWVRMLLEALERRAPGDDYERMVHELRLDVQQREATGRWSQRQRSVYKEKRDDQAQ